jgi:hypothetical protein
VLLPSPSRAYQAPLLTAMMLTRPHLAVPLHLCMLRCHPPSQPHGPHCCTPPSHAGHVIVPLPVVQATSSRPSKYVHHVATSLPATCTTLSCPSQLCAPCCHTPPCCAHYIVMPLLAMCAPSLPLSQLHVLCRHAPHGCIHHVWQDDSNCNTTHGAKTTMATPTWHKVLRSRLGAR